MGVISLDLSTCPCSFLLLRVRADLFPLMASDAETHITVEDDEGIGDVYVLFPDLARRLIIICI